MTPFEDLYEKWCRSKLWFDEVGDWELVGSELVRVTNEDVQKMRVRMCTAQCKQKSNEDVRHRSLEFEVGDMVFLRVASMKGVLRSRHKGKLSPRFIGCFEILNKLIL